MPAATIEFFWDAASPYTYLAATQIEALAARSGAEVIWKPFLLAKIFEASGNRMPASVPAKGRYLFSDVALWAKHYGVGLSFPKIFPINSLLALRCACAAQALGMQPQFAQGAMRAYWVEGADISQPAALSELADRLGMDGAALLQQAAEPPAKDALRANTEEAVARHMFGAPTFFVGKQMFWGNDRLPLLEAFIAGKLAA